MIRYIRHRGDLSQIEGIINLENETSKGKKDKNSFSRLFENNPISNSIIILAIDDENKIIGKSHTIPTLLGHRGQTFLAHLSCRTVVHPSARKQGVFLKIIDRINREIKKEGGRIRCGFPNKNVTNSLKKYFNSERKAEIILMVKMLHDSSSLIKAIISFFISKLNSLQKLKKDNKFYLEKNDFYDSELNHWLINNLKVKEEIYFFKDVDFLNWRFKTYEGCVYDKYTLYFKKKACGYVVLKNTENSLIIVDFQTSAKDKKSFSKMLKLIENQYPNVKSIYLCSGKKRWYHRFLKYNLFFSAGKRRNIDFTLKDFSNYDWPKDIWDIHIGDSDII